MENNQSNSILERIKRHKLVSAFLLIGAAIIWLSDITESVSKFATSVEKIYLDANNDIPELLEELVTEIQSQKDESKDFSSSYEKIKELLSRIGESESLILEASRFNEPLFAIKLKNIIIISTIDQYKIDGLVLFFDAQTGKVLLKDNDYGLGISSVKVISKTNTYPSSLVIVKYITISGTGTFGHSVKFYTIDNNLVLTSLDKPYSEVNSGWGAFETDTVEFKTRNDIVVKNGVMEIQTSGVAIVHGKELSYRELPDELYVWQPNSRSFDQVEGRVTHMQGLMTHIYSDIADARGNWFKKPRVLESGNVNEIFKEEQW